MLTVVVTGLLVVLLSALCAMSEAALLTLPVTRARALAKLGGVTARVLLGLKERVQNAISALVILDTVVDVVGTAVVTTAAARVSARAAVDGDFFSASVPWVTALLTVLLILFGEVVPKTLGERFHVGVSLAAALPVKALVVVLHPLVWATEKMMEAILPRRRRAVTSAEEITALAEQARKEGAIRSREAEVIQRVFRLSDITAEDIMTPRIRAKMLPADATLEGARTELMAIAYSRIPVYAGTRDHVTGVVRRAEALRGLAEGLGGTKLSDLAGRARFVPGTMAVDRLLLEFQKERVQLGIVVGEYGETVGLVTVEDIMEELVGEILDEKDVDERTIKRVSRDEILVHGQTETQQVNRFFNTELPEDRPTIAGLLLERLGRLPRAGEHVLLEGLDVVVEGVSERAIERVRILKPAAERPAAAPGERSASRP
jgi:CBS domain containing-hemolysin-like protein